MTTPSGAPDARAASRKKTIAEHMRDVLLEAEPVPGYLPAVMWGDVHLLDDCASRAAHTNLMRTWPPYRRHKRIFAALERRPDLFEKKYVRMGGGRWEGSPWWRMFELKERTVGSRDVGATEEGGRRREDPRPA